MVLTITLDSWLSEILIFGSQEQEIVREFDFQKNHLFFFYYFGVQLLKSLSNFNSIKRSREHSQNFFKWISMKWYIFVLEPHGIGVSQKLSRGSLYSAYFFLFFATLYDTYIGIYETPLCFVQVYIIPEGDLSTKKKKVKQKDCTILFFLQGLYPLLVYILFVCIKLEFLFFLFDAKYWAYVV